MKKHELTEEQDRAYKVLADAGSFYTGYNEIDKDEEADEDTDYDYRFLLNMNDTFFWGCADSENVPPEELPSVLRLFRRYGYMGLNYWVVKERGMKWTDIQFPSIQRQIQFIQAEEDIIAALPPKHNYCWSRAAYTIDSYYNIQDGDGYKKVLHSEQVTQETLE